MLQSGLELCVRGIETVAVEQNLISRAIGIRKFQKVQFFVGLTPSILVAPLKDTEAESGNMDLWVIEVARGTATRLTSNPADDEWAVWWPDGKRIAFDSNRKGAFDLYQMAIHDIGKETPMVESAQTKGVAGFSSDGR
jgi:Tol biopolymer transport system component